ncbi:MAG: hypothetical protein MO846_11555 [Candidatus Devosia symbiotica]|nr:hypothetical protein [Candidatus Devosia symbiotica]
MARRSRDARAQGSAIYLLAYYAGLSVIGTLGGHGWSHLELAGRGGIFGSGLRHRADPGLQVLCATVPGHRSGLKWRHLPVDLDATMRYPDRTTIFPDQQCRAAVFIFTLTARADQIMINGAAVSQNYFRLSALNALAGLMLCGAGAVFVGGMASDLQASRLGTVAQEILNVQAEALNGSLDKYRMLPVILGHRPDMATLYAAAGWTSAMSWQVVESIR